MELKSFAGCLVFLVLVISSCSEARHSVQRRETDEANFDDQLLADAASDDDTQNDADGGDDDDEAVSNAVIVTQPTSYNLTIGRSVQLECRVSPEDGSVVVQWSKDGIVYFIGNVKTNAPDRFSIDSKSTDLIIRDVETSDIGTYKCEILQDNAVSIEHVVHIFESPRIISFTASDKGHPVEGSNLVLTCVVSGMPPPEIVWSRDRNHGNERLTEKDGEFTHNSVTIKNVRPEHSGKYYCYAFNGINNSQEELTIVVAGKPRVHVHKAVINSAINVEAVLQCSIHDPGSVKIRWFKDSAPIARNSPQYIVNTRGHHSNLTVTPAGDEDFGTFTCEAENKYGKHNRSIQLVQSPVVEGLGADGPKLTWTVHSHLPLEEIELQIRGLDDAGEWRRITVPLPESRAREYSLQYALDDGLRSGRYEAVVKARNQHSWGSSPDSALVEIEARPEYVIRTAAVLPGSGSSIRPESCVLLTLMYLLVRM